MTAYEHLQAAHQAAKALAHGNMLPAVKTATVRHWVQQMRSYLKGGK